MDTAERSKIMIRIHEDGAPASLYDMPAPLLSMPALTITRSSRLSP